MWRRKHTRLETDLRSNGKKKKKKVEQNVETKERGKHFFL